MLLQLHILRSHVHRIVENVLFVQGQYCYNYLAIYCVSFYVNLEYFFFYTSWSSIVTGWLAAAVILTVWFLFMLFLCLLQQ